MSDCTAGDERIDLTPLGREVADALHDELETRIGLTPAGETAAACIVNERGSRDAIGAVATAPSVTEHHFEGGLAFRVYRGMSRDEAIAMAERAEASK